MPPKAPKTSSAPNKISRRKTVTGDGGRADADVDIPYSIAYFMFVDEEVLIITKGKWYYAKITEVSTAEHPEIPSEKIPCYHVHYPGWSRSNDEWVMAEALMKDTPENLAVGEKENGAPMYKNMVFHFCTEDNPRHYRKRKTVQRKTARVAKNVQQKRPVADTHVETKPAGFKKPKKSTRNAGEDSIPSKLERGNSASAEPTVSSVHATLRGETGPPEEVDAEGESLPLDQTYWRKKELYDKTTPGEPFVVTYDTTLSQQLRGANLASDNGRKQMFGLMEQMKIDVQTIQQKLHDSSFLVVRIPRLLKSALAYNYLQIVRRGKIMTKPSDNLTVGRILERYVQHCTENPAAGRSANWNDARLIEVQNLTNFFSDFLPRCLFRHEHPHLEDLMKGKKKIGGIKFEYGFVVITKMILLMVQHFNTNSRQITNKRTADNLAAIYQDMLGFIEDVIIPEQPDNLDSLYVSTTDQYRNRIQFGILLPGSGEQNKDKTFLSKFHHLSNQFFAQLLDQEISDDKVYGLKVIWKNNTNAEDGEKVSPA